MFSRRDFILATGAAAAAFVCAPQRPLTNTKTKMYGLIGKINATPGKREELIATLLEGGAEMPGCLSYIIAKDMSDEDSLWISEVWESKESHEASLYLPSVQEAISKGRQLIAGFGERFETVPVGGHGLVDAEAQ